MSLSRTMYKCASIRQFSRFSHAVYTPAAARATAGGCTTSLATIYCSPRTVSIVSLKMQRRSMSRLAAIMEQTKKHFKNKVLNPVDLSKPPPSIETIADFSNEDVVKQWKHESDARIGGESTASVTYEAGGHLSFEGNLSTAVPAGARIKQSGYCLLRSPSLVPSFFGEAFHDFSAYNGLELEVRGDGRVYICNIHTDGLQQEDLFQSAIYTRGGPLWQKVRIPFCDFLLTSLGYVQNEQAHMDLTAVKTVGILLADEVDGPFRLDIRSIKAVNLNDVVSTMEADAPKSR
eukprot:m.116268 g.116268  ORF g.116268 m.116268 type:complete len:290 (+) comp17174_c0_seq1:134-1003(+)